MLYVHYLDIKWAKTLGHCPYSKLLHKLVKTSWIFSTCLKSEAVSMNNFVIPSFDLNILASTSKIHPCVEYILFLTNIYIIKFWALTWRQYYCRDQLYIYLICLCITVVYPLFIYFLTTTVNSCTAVLAFNSIVNRIN